MNKFALVVIFAAVIGAAVASPTLDSESARDVDAIMKDVAVDEDMSFAAGEEGLDTSNMRKEDLYFVDFCKEATDTFKSFLQSKVDGTSSKIYNILFTSIQEVGQAVLDSQRQAACEGTNMIEGAAPVPSEEGNTEVDAPASMLARIRAATMNVVYSMYETAKSNMFVKLAELKELYNLDLLKQTIEDVCSSISSDLQRTLDQKLTETKNSIKRAAAGSADSKDILAIVQKAKMNNIGCKLTSRVSKVSEGCTIYKLAADRIWSALGAE